MVRYTKFCCQKCGEQFESNDFRIVKRADGHYYATYCPFCGELIYKRKAALRP